MGRGATHLSRWTADHDPRPDDAAYSIFGEEHIAEAADYTAIPVTAALFAIDNSSGAGTRHVVSGAGDAAEPGT